MQLLIHLVFAFTVHFVTLLKLGLYEVIDAFERIIYHCDQFVFSLLNFLLNSLTMQVLLLSDLIDFSVDVLMNLIKLLRLFILQLYH